MKIQKIIEKIHRKFSKDTDYPNQGSEDLLIYLDYIDDAITVWENMTKEGYNWQELMAEGEFSFSGTGEDKLPENFLSFPTCFCQTSGFQGATFVAGGREYKEIRAFSGEKLLANNKGAGNVFWIKGDKICTLPALNGNFTLNFLKKATRFTTGVEEEEIDMKDPKFIEQYALAQVFLDNGDDTQYQNYITQANEIIKTASYETIV